MSEDKNQYLSKALAQVIEQLLNAEDEIERLKARIAWLTAQLDDADLALGVFVEHLPDLIDIDTDPNLN